MKKGEKCVLIVWGVIIVPFIVGLICGHYESKWINTESVSEETKDKFELRDLVPRPSMELKTLEKLNEEDIIFVKQYKNWAEGFQNECYFVNAKGEIFWAYLWDEDEKYSQIEELLIYLNTYKETEPVGVIDKEQVEKYYQMYIDADKYAKIEEIPTANDAGQDTIYGIGYKEDGKSHVQTMYSWGDYEKINEDENAQMVASWLSEVIREKEWELMGLPRELEDEEVVFVAHIVSDETGEVNRGYYINGKGEIRKFDISVNQKRRALIGDLVWDLPTYYKTELVGTIEKDELEEKYHTLFQEGEIIYRLYQEEPYYSKKESVALYGMGYGMINSTSLWFLGYWENGELTIQDMRAKECVEWLWNVLENVGGEGE